MKKCLPYLITALLSCQPIAGWTSVSFNSSGQQSELFSIEAMAERPFGDPTAQKPGIRKVVTRIITEQPAAKTKRSTRVKPQPIEKGVDRRKALQTGLAGLLHGMMTPELEAQVAALPTTKLLVDLSEDQFRALGEVVVPLKAAFKLLETGIAPVQGLLSMAAERLYPLTLALTSWRGFHSEIAPYEGQQSLHSILNEFIESQVEQFRLQSAVAESKSLRDLCLAAVSHERDADYLFDIQWGLTRFSPMLKSMGIQVDIQEVMGQDGLIGDGGYSYSRVVGPRLEFNHAPWLTHQLRPLVEQAVSQYSQESGLAAQPEFVPGHANLNNENITKETMRSILNAFNHQLRIPGELKTNGIRDFVARGAQTVWAETAGINIEFDLGNYLRSELLPLTREDFKLWLTDRGKYFERRKRQFQLARWTDHIHNWKWQRHGPMPADKEDQFLKALKWVPQELMETLDEKAMSGVLQGIIEKGGYEKPAYSRPALLPGPSLHDYAADLARRLRKAAQTSDIALTIFLDQNNRLLKMRWVS